MKVNQTTKDELIGKVVKVDVSGIVYAGKITGRKLDYPMVIVAFGTTTASWEFSWDTVKRAVENNTTLVV